MREGEVTWFVEIDIIVTWYLLHEYDRTYKLRSKTIGTYASQVLRIIV